MRSYELMYILDPTLDEDASNALVGKIEDLMSKQGVTVENTEPWGKRRLAYQLKGHWEGNYVLSNLKADPSAISEMERRLRVTDGVLRFLTVRLDEQQAKLERRKSRRHEKDKARRSRKAQKASEGQAAEGTSSTEASSARSEGSTASAGTKTETAADKGADAAKEE